MSAQTGTAVAGIAEHGAPKANVHRAALRRLLRLRWGVGAAVVLGLIVATARPRPLDLAP